MSANIDLLARVRAEAHNVQAWSDVVVDDYLASAGKTDEELEDEIVAAQLTHMKLEEKYDALVQEAGRSGVLLTHDTPGFEETLSVMRNQRRSEGKGDSFLYPTSWEALHDFPTYDGPPPFGHPLTVPQLLYWQENERLRLSFMRAWTMYKDIQWRLTARGYGNQLHADTRFDFDIVGNQPELSRVDGITVSTFTAWDPFVQPNPGSVDTSHSPMDDSDSLFGGPISLSDDGVDEVIQVSSDENDTMYVNSDAELTEVPSESADSADLPHWNYRDYPTSDEGQSSPAGPVKGLRTQDGWSDSSPFGLPKTRTRLRYTRPPTVSQQAPAHGHTRRNRSGTHD